MKAGGNRRLFEYLEVYGLNSLGLEKYYTHAAEHYRQTLKAEAQGVTPSMPYPSLEEGRQYFIEPVTVRSSDEFEAYARTQKKKPGFWSSATSFLGSAASKVGELATGAADKVREQGIMDKVKSTASSVTKKVRSSLFGPSQAEEDSEDEPTQAYSLEDSTFAPRWSPEES
jgi:hypothetical protein